MRVSIETAAAAAAAAAKAESNFSSGANVHRQVNTSAAA